MRIRALAIFAALLAAGCGDDHEASPDDASVRPDARTDDSDGAAGDASVEDGGGEGDAGAPDAGPCSELPPETCSENRVGPYDFSAECPDLFPPPECHEGTRLWPTRLAPFRPGRQFPDLLDSSRFSGYCHNAFQVVPRFIRQPTFTAVAVADEHVVVAFGIGVALFELTDSALDHRDVLESYEGGSRSFLRTYSNLEGNNVVHTSVDIAAIPGTDEYLVAVQGDPGIGHSLFQVAQSDSGAMMGRFAQLYQDGSSGGGSGAIRILNVEGALWVVATGSILSGERALALSAPCTGDEPTCDVRVGELPRAAGQPTIPILDATVFDGAIHLVTGSGFAADLVRLPDPSDPSSVVTLTSLGSLGFAEPALFERDGRLYLAAAEQVGGPRLTLRDLTPCARDGACEVPPVAVQAPLDERVTSYSSVQASMDGGETFVYVAGQRGNRGSGIGYERMFTLEGAEGSLALVPMGHDGGRYVSPASGEEVDYFGDYLLANGFGSDGARAQGNGLVHRGVFIRILRSAIDMHHVLPPACDP